MSAASSESEPMEAPASQGSQGAVPSIPPQPSHPSGSRTRSSSSSAASANSPIRSPAGSADSSEATSAPRPSPPPLAGLRRRQTARITTGGPPAHIRYWMPPGDPYQPPVPEPNPGPADLPLSLGPGRTFVRLSVFHQWRSDHRAEHEALNRQVEGLGYRVGLQDGNMTSLTGQMTALTGQMTTLTGQMTALTGQVTTLTGQMANTGGDFRGALGRTEENVRNTMKRVEEAGAEARLARMIAAGVLFLAIVVVMALAIWMH